MSKKIGRRKFLALSLGGLAAAALTSCQQETKYKIGPCEPELIPDPQEFLRDMLERHNNRYTRQPIEIGEMGTLDAYFDEGLRTLNTEPIVAIAQWGKRAVKRAAQGSFDTSHPEIFETYNPTLEFSLEGGSSVVFAEQQANNYQPLDPSRGLVEFTMPGSNGDVTTIWASQQPEQLLRSTITGITHHFRELSPNPENWLCVEGIEPIPGTLGTEVVANALGGLVKFSMGTPPDQRTHDNYRSWQREKASKLVVPTLGQEFLTIDTAAVDPDTFSEFYSYVLPAGVILDSGTGEQFHALYV